MDTVNIGVIGIGNCASSLVQGVRYYADGDRPGLANPVCAGYGIGDVRFTSAFDVDAAKVGRDLSEAIAAGPNNSREFASVGHLGVTVADGLLADGVSGAVSGHVDPRGSATVEDLAAHLTATGTRVLVNFLPVGAQKATEAYAEAALRAGCAFVNCMPSVIARDPKWVARFAGAGLPLVGDDLKSQFGATLVHHALMDTLARNGVRVTSTYQLLSGGNMDFLNMQDPERMATKVASKSSGMVGAGESGASKHVGADYNPSLGDRKIAFIRVEGEAFGGTPLELDLKMVVDDSPSAAGNALDAVRYAARAMARGEGGDLGAVSANYMKAPAAPLDAAAIAAGLAAYSG